MDYALLLNSLAAQFPALLSVLSFLGLLVVVGQAVVVLTPSTADDAAWAKIKSVPVVGQLISALAAFAPVHKN